MLLVVEAIVMFIATFATTNSIAINAVESDRLSNADA